MSDRLAGLLEQARNLEDSPGVYLMKDAGKLLLYIGKAVSLRSRVSSYFQKSANHRGKNKIMVSRIEEFEVIPCDSEVEALLMEARLIKDLQPPFNVMMKDGKSFPYIEVTNDDDFPLVRVSRSNHDRTSKYWGPFVAAGSLRPALDLLQKIFQFRNCELKIIEGHKTQKVTRPCLLHQIDRCTAPCAGRVSKEDYARDIRNVVDFLNGKTSKVRRTIKTRMKECAEGLRYEAAAQLRDQLKAIDGLKTAGPLGSQPELEIAPINANEGMRDLGVLLKMDFSPRSIEGFDIAHLKGEQTVASLVSFIDGRPFKEGYRHYRIRAETGGDDYAAMREVLSRRYGRLQDEGQPFPHIVLIDGGRGQLNTAVAVFEELGRPEQVVISLAKKEERIFVPWRKNAIALSRHETALRVLQHVRDEAHRFAGRYHHILRDKTLIDEG